MRTTRLPALLLLLSTPAHAALFAPDGASGAAKDACTLLVAVRHAEKDTTSKDVDPGLTEAGQARAKALAEALGQARVDAILVSPTRRAAETAAPLAAERKIQSRAIPLDRGVDAHVADLARVVREEAGKTVLVVGHSNTVPALLRALGAQVMDLRDGDYGDLFVLELCPDGSPRLVHGSFGAPAR